MDTEPVVRVFANKHKFAENQPQIVFISLCSGGLPFSAEQDFVLCLVLFDQLV